MSIAYRNRRDLDLDDLDDDDWHDRWEEFGDHLGHALSAWVWVGVVVLALVFILSLVALCYCCRRRRRGKILRAKPAGSQIPAISVTRPSTTHISENVTSTHQKTPTPPSGYPYPPPGGYPSQTTYYQHPQPVPPHPHPAPPYAPPAPPYAPAGAPVLPPPYDGYHQQPAYNPAFQPGPEDVKTPM
ncbi:protein shisa-5-like [Amphibalanus amphitrite]|uniref:protein shisa-5-like n=1 Tax=Amphibalanus amphitrite TaxID=1232801 RepID=UPI001C9231E5|nr:protein shisa-5-like [Amphibalanus amphitrite]